MLPYQHVLQSSRQTDVVPALLGSAAAAAASALGETVVSAAPSHGAGLSAQSASAS